MRPVTIRDIAERLGVSTATVSRVLNGREGAMISERTRERVRQAAEDVGYSPNPAARALVTGRSNLVALWMHNRFSFSPFVAQVVHAVMQCLHDTSTEMVLEYIDSPGGLGSGWAPLARWPMDGILAHEAPQFVAAYRATHPSQPAPIVGMGCWYDPGADFVGVDLRAGARTAMEHLLARTPYVAYLVNVASNTPGEPRHDAYTTIMDEAGAVPAFILCDDQSRASAREAIRCHIQQHGCPPAILCHNDDLAVGAYRGLCDLGVRVPDDVALVGCDGIEDTEFLPCPLSTVVQPVTEMCETAWRFLRARMEDPALPAQQVVLQARLEVRESSAHLASGSQAAIDAPAP